MSINQANLQEDQELVDLAKAGSREAISELIVRHHVAVRWLIGRYFRDRATVDDLAQEVFCDAMTGIQRLEDDRRFRPWLLKLARNKSVSHLRKLMAQRKAEDQLELMLLEKRQESVLNRIARTEDHDVVVGRLRECMALLSPKHQSLVKQFYFEGQPSEQIARANDVPGNTIRSMLFRIRGVLKKCLLQKLPDPGGPVA